MKGSPFKIFVLILLLGLFACQTKRQYTSKPSKSLVNPDSDLIEVNAIAYHVSDTMSMLFVEVINENIVYKRPDTTSAFYAELKVSYKLLSEQGSKKILDSNSYYVNDRANDQVEVRSLKTMFTIKANRGNNYYVDIQVFDLNKKVVYNKSLNVYKQDIFSDQNFLVNKNDQVVFSNRFMKNEVLTIQNRFTSNSKLYIDCFFKDFPPAAPPFSYKESNPFKYKPDSSFNLPLKNSEALLVMPSKGFYHLRSDSLVQEGLTLYSYDKTFPGVSNNDEMINCTRYLMNKEEFEACKNASDKKEAIDKFWLTIGGSNERARELLKRYYGRVKEANKYYSSYVPGWKTDRGMIFIIFGHPTYTYKNSKGETWVYGLESNPNSIRYSFTKTNNPFSDNDFILERSQFFKEPWYSAVDYWRQGHVYTNLER